MPRWDRASCIIHHAPCLVLGSQLASKQASKLRASCTQLRFSPHPSSHLHAPGTSAPSAVSQSMIYLRPRTPPKTESEGQYAWVSSCIDLGSHVESSLLCSAPLHSAPDDTAAPWGRRTSHNRSTAHSHTRRHGHAPWRRPGLRPATGRVPLCRRLIRRGAPRQDSHTAVQLRAHLERVPAGHR